MSANDFSSRRARQEAAKLAGVQHYGPRLTFALMQDAARRAARVLPYIAACAVVKHASARVFDGPEAA